MTPDAPGGRSLLQRLHDFEMRVVRAIARQERRARWRRVMLAATRAADGWGLALVVPVVLWVGGARGLTVIACGAVSGVVTAILVQATKWSVGRARPRGVELLRPISATGAHAFPSGHAAQAFSVVVFLGVTAPWLAAVFLPFAVASAVSRVFFGLHYPSDVVAGAVLGTAVALTVTVSAHAAGWLDWPTLAG